MTRPMSIDHDIPCPECGQPMEFSESGYAGCFIRTCRFISEIHPKHVAALRNQRPPGTTEIPDAALDDLAAFVAAARKQYSPDRHVAGDSFRGLFNAAIAILAHIPAKVDTKRDLRTIRDLIGSVEDLPQAIHDQLAAKWRAADEAMGRIEAAIRSDGEAMRYCSHSIWSNHRVGVLPHLCDQVEKPTSIMLCTSCAKSFTYDYATCSWHGKEECKKCHHAEVLRVLCPECTSLPRRDP